MLSPPFSHAKERHKYFMNTSHYVTLSSLFIESHSCNKHVRMNEFNNGTSGNVEEKRRKFQSKFFPIEEDPKTTNLAENIRISARHEDEFAEAFVLRTPGDLAGRKRLSSPIQSNRFFLKPRMRSGNPFLEPDELSHDETKLEEVTSYIDRESSKLIENCRLQSPIYERNFESLDNMKPVIQMRSQIEEEIHLDVETKNSSVFSPSLPGTRHKKVGASRNLSSDAFIATPAHESLSGTTTPSAPFPHRKYFVDFSCAPTLSMNENRTIENSSAEELK